MLPSQPKALHQAFTVMQRAPFVEALTITVGGNGTNPTQQADLLANALRGPLFPVVITGASQTNFMDTLTRLHGVMPALLPENAWSELTRRLTPQAIHSALQANKNELLSPRGIGMRALISQDPLNIRSLALAPLANLARPSGMQWGSGHMLDATENYAMIIAKPSLSMTNAANANTIMRAFEKAAAAVAPGTHVLLVSGHRHTKANAKIIQEDLARIIPASLVLLFAAFVFFLQSWRGVSIFFVPLGALVLATAATALFYGTVSGIVLGFGSVLLGITADYAIHMYFAMRTSATAQQAITSIAPPMLMAALTTMAAFAVMHISSIPAIQQMSTLAITGIVAALLFSLVILPLCLRPGTSHTMPTVALVPSLQLAPVKLGIAWAGIFLVLTTSLPNLHFDGDIRSLAYTDATIQKDEDTVRSIWHASREGTVIAATSPSQKTPFAHAQKNALEDTLQTNDAVWDVLQHSPDAQHLKGKILSLGPLLPSQRTQQLRHKNWETFWASHRNNTMHLLTQQGISLGFAPQAFEAFAQSLSLPPRPVLLPDVEAMGFDLFSKLLLRTTPEEVTAFTLITDIQPLSGPLVQAIEATGALVASGESFRAMVQKTTQHDLLLLSGLSLLSIIICIMSTVRNFSRSALVLLPTGGSIAGVLALFALLKLPVTLFHAVSFPLIMALSVDYGLFMLASMQGQLDTACRKGVALSAITTVISFGCLAFARHPALFSIGVTVGSGIAVSFALAMLLPCMTCPHAMRRA
ncbi:hypothetical protein MASR1M90_19430 [Desulfovibrionales bacterium]